MYKNYDIFLTSTVIQMLYLLTYIRTHARTHTHEMNSKFSNFIYYFSIEKLIINMNVAQSVLSSHTKTPVLLCIPDLNAKGKNNERPSVPLLKVNLSNVNRNQEKNIFRLPTEYFNSPSISYNVNETKHNTYPSIPKLIDIRSVLKSARSQKNNCTNKQNSVLNKDVKLIKLPIIAADMPLLDSPKRKMTELPKHKPVEKEEPHILDIRPFTPHKPVKLIDTKKISEKNHQNHKLNSR